MSSTDTCVVRPELIEFEKYSTANQSSLFLSLVAHPSTDTENASFRFTNKEVTSIGESDVTLMNYTAENLCDLYAQQMFVSNIESTMISTVSILNMAVGGEGVVDMNMGNIVNINHMVFEAGTATQMTVTNDHIKFGEASGILDMTQGNIDNTKFINMAPDSVTDINYGKIKNIENIALALNAGELNVNGGTIVMGNGNIDMTTGAILNLEDLKIGEIRLHNTNRLNNDAGESLFLENVKFKDGNVAELINMTFTDMNSTLDMTNGTIQNVSYLRMNNGGIGEVDMNDGTIVDLKQLDFGSTLRVKKDGSTLDAVNVVPMIYNENSYGLDLEGILFNSKVMSKVNDISFSIGGGGVVDMNDGSINNLGTVNMTESGVLNMNNSNMHNLNSLNIGFVDLDGPTATIQHNNSGAVTLEGVVFQDQTITQLLTTTFAADGSLNMSDGNIVNVAEQIMTVGGSLKMSGGTIDFGGSVGALELKGAGEANIGVLNLSGITLKNGNAGGGSVNVEASVFTDTTIQTRNINMLNGDLEMSVENTVFAGDDLTVTNIHTDVIVPKNGNALTLKTNTTIDLADTATSSAVRITNLASPIADTDAANKAYVKTAVQENSQGLKPKKASDYSLFGGFATTIPSDFNKTANNVFGDFEKYCIQFTPTNNGAVDDSTLSIHVKGGTGDVFLMDGAPVNKSEIDTIAASVGGLLAKKRVLIMNLNNTSISETAAYSSEEFSDQTNFLSATDVKLKGLNGLWEIYTYVESGITGWKHITMKRAYDMNENDELMNGTYLYVKNGTSRSNYGFVVTSNDPLKIGKDGANRGLTIDGADAMKEVQWIEFNNLDYELAFVNEDGVQKELLGDVQTTFQKGGIVMKFDATDEKQVMVNAEYLRYETDIAVTGGLALQINGNIDFNLVDIDSHINSYSDSAKVFVNGTRFERLGTTANIVTTNIVANTVTCESDRNLKKNIKPMLNGIELVSKLNAVTYNWNTDDLCESLEYGFIAQEVEENYPTLVRTNHQTGIKSVDYQKMVSLLALAVQELAARL